MMSAAKYRITLWSLCCALIVLFIASISIGLFNIPFIDVIKILCKNFGIEPTWSATSEYVVWTLRLPRTIAATLVGGALALSGAAYQSMFRNPMVSPDILGVTSGACVGAATAILLSLGNGMIQLFAFIGGIAAVILTILIPRMIRNNSTIMLVLSGIIVGSVMSSLMNIIKFIADPETKLAEITYWTMGSFVDVTMSEMISVLPALIIPMAVLLLMRYRLNVLALGDFEAKTLGVNIRRTRGLVIVCSTLLTAASVCIAGTIGWVGLVIPHFSRMIVGADNKKMLPVAVVFGSVFMIIIDILCRTLTMAELRISVLTGIIGAPFYLFILVKQRNSLR